MSFLAGRLAAVEGSYFLQESKHAVTRIAQTQKNLTQSSDALKISEASINGIPSPDVLPEVMRHSLPSKMFNSSSEISDTSFLSKTSKWALKSDPEFKRRAFASDAINPLGGFTSIPNVTLGPRRWQKPSKHAVVASTANDLRTDKYNSMTPEKLEATATGFFKIGAGFSIATALVFGGASLIFGTLASKLEIQKADEIRTKVNDFLHPTVESYQTHLAPLRNRVEEVSKKWNSKRKEYVKEMPLCKELKRTLGSRTSY